MFINKCDCVFVLIFDLVMKSLRGYFIDAAGKRADIILSANTFGRVLGIKLSEKPNRVGYFANNLQEFDSFREFFTSTTLVALVDLPFVLLFIVIIFSLGGALALVPIAAIPTSFSNANFKITSVLHLKKELKKMRC